VEKQREDQEMAMRVDGGGFNDVFYGDDRLDEMMEDDMLMDN